MTSLCSSDNGSPIYFVPSEMYFTPSGYMWLRTENLANHGKHSLYIAKFSTMIFTLPHATHDSINASLIKILCGCEKEETSF